VLGLAPDEMEMGRRRGVSIESAAKWRRKREAAARKSQETKEPKETAVRRRGRLPEAVD
jgi:hypothetical protein